MLTESAPSLQEAKVEVATSRGNIYRVYNRKELVDLLDRSSYGQLRGIFDYSNNEMFVVDASLLTHADIQEEAAAKGDIQFTVQYRFGSAEQIDLGDNITLATSEDEEDFSPAFARALGVTYDDLITQYRKYAEAL